MNVPFDMRSVPGRQEFGRSSRVSLGLPMRHTFYCVRCQADRDQKGGKTRGGMFTCALHFKEPTQ